MLSDSLVFHLKLVKETPKGRMLLHKSVRIHAENIRSTQSNKHHTNRLLDLYCRSLISLNNVCLTFRMNSLRPSSACKINWTATREFIAPPQTS